MSSNLKHKEEVTTMTEMALKDKKALAQLFDVVDSTLKCNFEGC
jgi:hypothetical protein